MRLYPIDFTQIRGDTVEGQRSSFEQLVCHIAELDGGRQGFRRIEGSGGDGGVEALRLLPSGKKVGYQAKYYTSREGIDWSKLDSSVRTALVQHPELESYVIALPCDFTGKRAARGGSTDGAWGKWDDQVKIWKGLATARGMTVEFEPWTAFEIEVALLKPAAQYLIQFFFDRLVLTREWMQHHLDLTVRDLQARYSPDEHVNTESLKAFDVIYRRQNVRQDLREVFELARSSNPRAAAALAGDPPLPEEDVLAAEASQREFLELAEAVDWTVETSWPVRRWNESWHSFTRRLLTINDAVTDRRRAEEANDRELMRSLLEEKSRVYALIGPEVFGGRWHYLLPIDEERAVLFVGRAGSGKSHALARGAEIAWGSGAPVIHVLGQHIMSNDPRASILQRLEIADWSFHDFLAALNLAAEAAKTRALLVIDALNEGLGTDVWRNHLASFLREINEHERIVLVVSCREEYLAYVVSSDLILDRLSEGGPHGKLVRVSVDGFRTTEEREAAVQSFMISKGIVPPTAPVLDDEFFNPLFMSSVCRSMAKAGVKVFPRGLHGTREMFAFVLETKSKAFGTRHDGTPRAYQALLAALGDLAGSMVERRADSVPLSVARELIDEAFKGLPIVEQEWLDSLEGSDILRRDVEEPQRESTGWSQLNEVVRFAFQRLQDNLIAERLLLECRGIDVEDSFQPGAPLEFLVRRSTQKDGTDLLRFNPRWVGALGALWSAVAEKHGKELWDLRSFFGGPDVFLHCEDFQPVFHTSLRERKGTAFNSRTLQIFNFLWENERQDKLSIVLSFSCIPGHAWNADFLAGWLFSISPADRASTWSHWFADERSALVNRATNIAEWAQVVDATAADAEVVRLAGITLTWLLTVENPALRDRAAKGLTKLIAGVPALLPDLKGRFHTIEDSNLREVLFGTGSPSMESPD